MTWKKILEAIIMEIIMRKKAIAIGLIILSVPMLWFGIANFEIGGISDQWLAVTVATSGMFGLFGIGGGIAMLIPGTMTAVPRNEPVLQQPALKEIKMVNEIADTPSSEGASESVRLMKREKELMLKRGELQTLLGEVDTALITTKSQIRARGWVEQEGGGWQVE